MCNLTNDEPTGNIILVTKRVWGVQSAGAAGDFWNTFIPTMNCGPAVRVSPGSLLEMQTLRPNLDLRSQNLHVHVLWWFMYTLTFKKPWSSLANFRIFIAEEPGGIRGIICH